MLEEHDGTTRLISRNRFRLPTLAARLGSLPMEPGSLGQPFDGPMPGHNPTMPIHYDLHVWLWGNNPAGLFAPFNPNLSCPS